MAGDMTAKEMKIAEEAYRRGAHQALHMLAYYMDEESYGNIKDVVRLFRDNAEAMRYDGKPHARFMHEVFQRVWNSVP